MPRCRRRRHGFQTLLKRALWLCLAALAALTAAAWAPTDWWPLVLAGHARLQLTLASLVLLVVIAVGIVARRRVRLAFAAACLLLALNAQALWRWVDFGQADAVVASDLTVLMANLQVGQNMLDAIAAHIDRHDPDIFVAVEVDPAWLLRAGRLIRHYPYVVTEPRVHGFGLAIFAKYPLVDVAVADLAIRGIPTVFATLRHPGGDVRVVATHPLPPVQPAAADRRDEQLTAIAALVRQETLPVVVVGDLNTTMYATNYRRFAAAAGLANARASRGLAPTWPTAWPWALRIPLDHILHGPGLVTTEFAALAPIGSDHLPVFAAFRIATGGDAVTE